MQDPSNTIGVLARIEPDGSIPLDNPFVDVEGRDPSIWSWGHRNIEGGAIHPDTGELWTHEFGPWGGDELIIPRSARSLAGGELEATLFRRADPRPADTSRVRDRTPVISPSGLVFYTGSAIPDWQGNILIGGLSSNDLIRLTLRDETVIGEERIGFGARIRDVAQGPDGAVYLLTDQPCGEIFRLRLEESAGN